MAKTAFIGLGVMGYPMAGWLARKGHEVTVYNRTGAKAEAWAKENGGAAAPTPGEAAAPAPCFAVRERKPSRQPKDSVTPEVR